LARSNVAPLSDYISPPAPAIQIYDDGFSSDQDSTSSRKGKKRKKPKARGLSPGAGFSFLPFWCLIPGATGTEQFSPEASAEESAAESESSAYGEKPSKRRKKNAAVVRSEFDYVRSSARNGREVRRFGDEYAVFV
jgi:hypothetical protein